LQHETWTCPSCGARATARYCGNCGERGLVAAGAKPETPGHNEPARSFFARLLATLRALASPPGRLTVDWISGRRVGYLSPLSLLLWMNVVFFVVQSLTGLGILTWPLKIHLADDAFAWLDTRLLAMHHPEMRVPTAAFADKFDALEAVHAKSLVIVMVPALAAVLGVLTLDRRERFRGALIFATHFFAFALLWLCALFPLLAIVLRLIVTSGIPAPAHHSLDLMVTAVEAAVLGWYIYVALDTAFGLSRLRRAATTLALIAALFYILRVYHAVVFAVTLYSI
jgi:uncharacterized protein DUF3667